MIDQDAPQAMRAAATSKLCSSCAQLHAVNEFRRRVAGGEQRHTECRTCYNASMRQRRRSLRAKELVCDVGRLSRRSIRRSEVELIASAMVQRFGGLHRLSAAWKSAIDEARVEQPGGRLALHSMVAVMRMIEVTSRRFSPPDLAELDDDDLTAEIERLIDQKIAQLVD